MARFGKNFPFFVVGGNICLLSMYGKMNKTANTQWWLHVWATSWPIFTVLAALLTGYRIVMSADISSMLETNDIPALLFFQTHLEKLAIGVTVTSGICLFSCGCLYRKLGTTWAGLSLWITMATCGVLAGVDAIWALTDRVSFEMTKVTSFLDWTRIAAFPVAGLLFLTMSGGRNWDGEERISKDRPWRYQLTFVFGALSAFLYALVDHIAFWSPSLNGGYHYGRFFLEGEITQANTVLFSTSMLFASLVGMGAILCRVGFRGFCVHESGRLGRWCPAQGRQAMVVTLLWSFSLSLPWLLKLWPEIQGEGAWILPFATIGFIFSALVGPIGMASKLLVNDELIKRQTCGPEDGASERAFLTATLFLVYPIVRWIPLKTPARRREALLFLGLAITTLLTWLSHVAYDKFSFEDWRGMLKKSQLPFLQVLCSALLAFGLYLWWKRFVNWRGYARSPQNIPKSVWREYLWGRRLTLVLFVSLPLGGVWSFWGWVGINENVFARTAEFNDRHRFELLALHWVLDGDGDGYASLLHGADPDGSDPSILAGGMAAVGPTFAQEDVFRVENLHAREKFPNIVLLFLEGVTPNALSVSGERRLEKGRLATPHLDQLAEEGAFLSNARVAYPSTWDTWYGALSGRLLRVMEMSARWKFEDRYSRLNNIQKTLETCDIQRWCYPDVAGFSKLFLTDENRRMNWQPQLDASLSSKEKEEEISRGDKRMRRIIDFVDDLKEDESFFICEHMADTHFPWKRTSDKRARQLGFAEGLGFAEEGGKTDQQKRYYQTISRMDGQIGVLTKRLKERGFYDKTCVIIVGDHGCQWHEHERGYYVSHLYEQSIRIPLIIKLPKNMGLSGVRIEAPVIPQDILPTLCEIGGLAHEPNEVLGPLYGNSLLPLLDGREPQRGSDKRWNRDMLLITHYDKAGVLHRARWKLIFDRPVGTYRLFDLQNDPEEMKNLADSEKNGMMKTLSRLLQVLGWRHRHFLGGIRWADDETAGKP